MKIILTIFLLLVCSGSVLAEKKQKTYLCIGEVAGGLDYNTTKNAWEGMSFDTDNKYLLKTNDKQHPSKVATVTQTGRPIPLFQCEPGRLLFTGEQLCDGPFGQFAYNLESLRFLSTFMSGYIDGKIIDGLTPYIQGGTCSPL